MPGAVIRSALTCAAQAAVLGGVCVRAEDGAVSKDVMSSRVAARNLLDRQRDPSLRSG
jgi:hypothetical protein